MSNKLDESKKQSENNRGRVKGSKNYVTQRRFIYASQMAEKVGFNVILEIKTAVSERNHEMVKALIPLLKYMAPEIAAINTSGDDIPREDINLNLNMSGLIWNHEQDSND